MSLDKCIPYSYTPLIITKRKTHVNKNISFTTTLKLNNTKKEKMKIILTLQEKNTNLCTKSVF